MDSDNLKINLKRVDRPESDYFLDFFDVLNFFIRGICWGACFGVSGFIALEFIGHTKFPNVYMTSVPLKIDPLVSNNLEFYLDHIQWNIKSDIFKEILNKDFLQLNSLSDPVKAVVQDSSVNIQISSLTSDSSGALALRLVDRLTQAIELNSNAEAIKNRNLSRTDFLLFSPEDYLVLEVKFKSNLEINLLKMKLYKFENQIFEKFHIPRSERTATGDDFIKVISRMNAIEKEQLMEIIIEHSRLTGEVTMAQLKTDSAIRFAAGHYSNSEVQFRQFMGIKSLEMSKVVANRLIYKELVSNRIHETTINHRRFFWLFGLFGGIAIGYFLFGAKLLVNSKRDKFRAILG